jgi:pyruvate/2-oxoglutarate dehydrogenase complex dihydrolipoamide dehydrogenase (E3) component
MEQIAYQPEWHRTMIARRGVEVRLGEELTIERIRAERPDVVVIATGAKPALPEIAGLGAALKSGFARTIDRVLGEGSETLSDGPILVWGAAEGVELALDLARSGRKVRLLDPRAKFAPTTYIGSRARYVLLWAAQAELVPETSVELVAVGNGKVTLRHADGREESAACAHLIVAPGRTAHDPLSAALLGSGIEVHVVGDARSPRSYGNAIHEAAYLARRI